MSRALQRRALERIKAWLCREEHVYNLLADYLSVKVGLAATAIENLSYHHRIECVIVANFNVVASLNLGTALTHDNHARASRLAVTKLDSEELWV
jgi:hypothetical protein